MSTRVLASSVFPLPVERVWKELRDFTFPSRLLRSLISSVTLRGGVSAFELGAVREVKWHTGESRTQQLIELSDQYHRIAWESLAADPPTDTMATITTIRLHRITETNETLVDWSIDFSADVRGDAIRFEQQGAQSTLLELKRAMCGGKRVLILGAGLVARPIVFYLHEKGYDLIVASRTLDRVRKLVGKLSHIRCVELDMESPQGEKLLEELTPTVDAVISMLPYLFHVKAAKIALKNGKHFLTTSYVSPGMKELEEEAKKKGLVIINECGVDPGTDHMSAMKVIDDVRRRGGEIVSFTSYCGGLPAPDANNNPFGYKLSWAPRGVLLASRNDAHFLRDGKDVTIAGKDLFDSFELHQVPGAGEFEGYPNRNCTQYVTTYGIPKVHTMIRGTYRNRGWCSTIKKMVDLGLLELSERNDLAGHTYAEVVAQIVGAPAGSDAAAVRTAAAARLKLAPAAFELKNLEWLGLFSTQRIGEKVHTLLDAVCQLFVEKLQYAPGERDMLLMQHTFVAEFPDRTETLTSSLVDYGIANGDTSMSRTVSYPVAIAARMVLEGRFTRPGLSIPTTPELYLPILSELKTLGIEFVERTVRVDPKNPATASKH